MIPLRDSAPRYSAPFVTVGLIVINTLVFIYQWQLDPFSLEYLFAQNGVVPLRFAEFVAGRASAGGAIPPLLTSMFLHGGFLHLLGNMWFLWIFGDNVEDQLGHFRYLVFYLACGLTASLAHIFLNLPSQDSQRRRQRRHCRGHGRLHAVVPRRPGAHPDPIFPDLH